MEERTDFQKLFLLATNANETISELIEELKNSQHRPWYRRVLGLSHHAKGVINRAYQVQRFLDMWGANNSE